MALGIYSVWANRLTDTNESRRMYWEDVPDRTKPGVLKELESRVKDGRLTQQQFDDITAA